MGPFKQIIYRTLILDIYLSKLVFHKVHYPKT